MATNTRRTRSDSTAGMQKSAREKKAVIAPPQGIQFEHEEEKIIWGQFTAARSPDNWREFDLVLVAKLVELEYDIRRYKAVLRKSGPIMQNKRGTMVMNPLCTFVDTWQRQQLAIIRSLSLGVHSDSARDLNKTGKTGSKDEDERDLKTIERGKVLSLIKV